MHSVTIRILLAFVVQTHAKEQVVNDSNVQDFVDQLADESVKYLFRRSLMAKSLHQADMDKVTLAKPDHHAIPPQSHSPGEKKTDGLVDYLAQPPKEGYSFVECDDDGECCETLLGQTSPAAPSRRLRKINLRVQYRASFKPGNAKKTFWKPAKIIPWPKTYISPENIPDKYKIIHAPLCTVHTMKMFEKENVVAFIVHIKSTKPEIKKALESMFNVKVKKVRTLITPRLQKKAYVSLANEFDALSIINRIGRITDN